MPFNVASVINFFYRTPLERRKYLRLDVCMPIHYFVIPQDQEKDIKKSVYCHAHSRNLSGGGLLLEVPLVQDELFFTTHLIKVEFELEKSSKPIDAIVRMVAVDKPEHVDNYYMRFEFVKITDENRNKILDFITHKIKKYDKTKK